MLTRSPFYRYSPHFYKKILIFQFHVFFQNPNPSKNKGGVWGRGGRGSHYVNSFICMFFMLAVYNSYKTLLLNDWYSPKPGLMQYETFLALVMRNAFCIQHVQTFDICLFTVFWYFYLCSKQFTINRHFWSLRL